MTHVLYIDQMQFIHWYLAAVMIMPLVLMIKILTMTKVLWRLIHFFSDGWSWSGCYLNFDHSNWNGYNYLQGQLWLHLIVILDLNTDQINVIPICRLDCYARDTCYVCYFVAAGDFRTQWCDEFYSCVQGTQFPACHFVPADWLYALHRIVSYTRTTVTIWITTSVTILNGKYGLEVFSSCATCDGVFDNFNKILNCLKYIAVWLSCRNNAILLTQTTIFLRKHKSWYLLCSYLENYMVEDKVGP